MVALETNHSGAFIVELKSGRYAMGGEDGVQAQLQGGLKLARTLLDGDRIQPRPFFVVLSNKHPPTHLTFSSDYLITERGRSHRVRALPCGMSFRKMVRAFGIH